MKGLSSQGNCFCFSRYAIHALEPTWITSRQMAMTRNARRNEKYMGTYISRQTH